MLVKFHANRTLRTTSNGKTLSLEKGSIFRVAKNGRLLVVKAVLKNKKVSTKERPTDLTLQSMKDEIHQVESVE